jgi:D-arabinose 1-dehydrogenase-like Zn-dependent alcohol dehydrogenase
MEEIRPGEIGDNELLVQMVASGICHTDLHVGNARDGGMGVAYYPRVLGHEGKGTGRERTAPYPTLTNCTEFQSG